jgi:hypothetical protein
MLRTQTILNTFLGNYTHIQVTCIQVQLGITVIWPGQATCPSQVEDRAGHISAAGSYLSLLGVWTESCPLVEACGFMIKEVLEGAEEDTHVVVRSKLL